jgi:hypothetical protein
MLFTDLDFQYIDYGIYEINSERINQTAARLERLHHEAMARDKSSTAYRPIWSNLMFKNIFEYSPCKHV